MITNIIFFTLIFALIVFIFYLTYSMQNENFGHKAYLYSPQKNSHTLIFIKKNVQPNVGDEILFTKNDGDAIVQFVDKVAYITDSSVKLSSQIELKTNSSDYLGKVVSKSKFWGKIVFSILNLKNELLIYIIIFLSFLVLTAFVLNLFIKRYKITFLPKKNNN